VVANDLENAKKITSGVSFDFAVVDLKLSNDSGLKVLKFLHQNNPDTRIVMLTGYASISTATESIKMGAVHYLSKPANADDIVSALHKTRGNEFESIPDVPLPLDQLEWEHINRVLLSKNGNITATALALNLHRRSLQRKLAKHSPLNKEKM